MTGNKLVFHDVSTDLDTLVEQLSKNPPSLDARDVEVVRAARAVDGEVWSPQLLPYESWAAHTAEADAGGTDGDLLVVGSLGMGISDEEREELLAQAAQRAAAEAAEADAGGRKRMEGGLRGAIEVREDVDGYALVGFDLRRFAEAAGCDDGLAVAVPAAVDGVPVVRIAAEAFARRRVQGVGVRLLVVPDTVRVIAANAFLALSAQRIHLGCGVRVLGEQPCDLAGVSPRLQRRCFSVDAGNERFSAREGSLFADEGRTLVFLASPYPARVDLPADVERVGASAFAQGCEPPSVVSCGSGLAHVEAKTWDDAVWLCPAAAPAYRALARRGVRLAGPHAVEQGGCWYDFDEAGGAHLVAGPPPPTSVSRHFASAAAERAAALRGQGERADIPSPGEVAAQAAGAAAAADTGDLLALPRAVEGRPLERIGVRALPYAPAALVVPDTVRVIERDNACRGTRRLVLPEGLERIGAHSFCSRILEGPVPIPASVRSVGEGCFEYAVCRLERTGAVVHVSADQLLSCFLDDPADGIPFDFARYDGLLLSGKNLPDRLGALLHRLAVPFCLADEARATLVARLREQEAEAMRRVAREGDRQMVEALVDAGFIDERTFDRQIELLRACNRTDCVLYLMEWHRDQGGPTKPPSARERFAL
ncbi:leucine-rich repeat domain-containing protein [Arabiibacter massiliensis]|uniref:hypothetical protein n=1 Tax=Arabiibacter massiliensis TaxID=1870985 RepID=UPI0009B99C93|nr:hypothetical protein [Arabiibacter massiliensis]